MADPQLVEDVVDWLNARWDSSNYPGSNYSGDPPAIISKDDGESQEWGGRKVSYDLSKNNAVEVSSSPDRLNEPIGTELDYDFEDGVSIRILAMPSVVVDHGGGVGVEDELEFRVLVQEVRRIIHTEREYPGFNTGSSQTDLALHIDDESNLSGQYGDLYEYDITVITQGYESL